jgi:predicted nucleic acid-binding protein
MPDVNVLVYAHRADDPSHAFYRDWLERLAAGPEPFALSPLVVGAFVRLVTNVRAFPGSGQGALGRVRPPVHARTRHLTTSA